MSRCTVLAVLASLSPLAIAPVAAQLPPGWSTTNSCACICLTATGYDLLILNPIGGSACGIFNGATCNIQDPATGGVRSGRLSDCSREIVSDSRGAGVLDATPGGTPGTGPGPTNQLLQGLPQLQSR